MLRYNTHIINSTWFLCLLKVNNIMCNKCFEEILRELTLLLTVFDCVCLCMCPIVCLSA